jgi:predicted Fe-S protein YdhL (DUF1289 family)
MSVDKKITNCIGKCRLHPLEHYCLGCWRTLEHIQNWRDYSEDERNEIIGKKTSDFIKPSDDPPRFTKLRTINNYY